MFHAHLRTNRHYVGSWGKAIYDSLSKELGFDFTRQMQVGNNLNLTPRKQLFIGIPDANISLKDPEIQFFLDFLQYKTLLGYNNDGPPSSGLATYHQGDDLSQWILKLAPTASWNDDYVLPIMPDDVTYSLKQSQRVMRQVLKIEVVSQTEIHISLLKKNRFFPYLIASLPVKPCDGRVTSSSDFQFTHTERNSIFFQRMKFGKGNVREITLRCYSTLPQCFNALKEQKLDFAVSMQPFSFKKQASFQSQPLARPNCFWVLMLNHKAGPFVERTNCEKLRDRLPLQKIEKFFTLNKDLSTQDKTLPRSSSSELSYSLYYQNSDSTRTMAEIIAKTTNANLYLVDRQSGEQDTGDAVLMMMFLGAEYDRLSEYFETDGFNNVYGFSSPLIDGLIQNMREGPEDGRGAEKGGEILKLLKDDFVFIPLGGIYEYIIAPFSIGYTLGFSSVHGFLRVMGDVNVPD